MNRLSLRWKLLAAMLVPAIAVFSGVAVWVLALTRQVLDAQLGDRLIAVAQATAATVPTDLLALLGPGDETTRTYANLRERLTAMQRETGAARVRLVDTHLKLLDTSDPGGRVGAPVPALARDQVELRRVLAGTPQASSVLFRGEDGQLYKTGYAPIQDPAQRVVGVVAVDASARFFAPLQGLRRRLFGLGAVAAGVLALLALALGHTLVRPVYQLVRAARRIGGGDLESPVGLPRGDELGVLANTLEHMRGQLLARDRVLQMMLAGVAHEVRNPLGGMELYAGLLGDDLREQPEQLALLGKIRREVDHLKVLVDDFLDFARNKPLQLEPTDLAALTREAVELGQPFLSAKGLSMAVSGVERSVRAQADGAALRRVLLNLLKNACEASPEGGQVRVELGQRGRWATLTVSDDGPGVPPDQREGIFEPFFTTKEKGTGLGLAFARKLAQAHGGQLEVKASAAGARFELSVPIARA